ncbi:MAG TPA: SIR2 family protein [Pseudolabrys sp.]|nr:SIR2 family protein [Pseudolabrys sp.]
MKWLPSSADIPEDLIRAARDGEVVFLCGAGVSLAAGLPLFKDLTDKVYKTIGASISDEAAEETAYQSEQFDRVLRSLEKRTRPPGAESAVRKAVIDALQAPPNADLSRHLALLRLSRDREGRPKLLTTNFDSLFELAALKHGITVASHAGIALPRPGGPTDFGILHLHGRIGDPNIGLEQSDLILTSADFGDAYLRHGWASRYIEDRMRINTLRRMACHCPTRFELPAGLACCSAPAILGTLWQPFTPCGGNCMPSSLSLPR